MPPPSANIHLFNLETLQTCILEDVPIPNSYDQRTLYTWLSGNRWLSLAHGIEIVAPCTEQTEHITTSFPQPIYAINSLSADYTKALFEAENAYYLYDFATAAAHEVTGIVPNNVDGSNTLWLTTAWSPDGTQVAAVVNVYGSVYLIDAQTGKATLMLEQPIPTSPQYSEASTIPVDFRAKRSKQYISHPLGLIPNWLAFDLIYIYDRTSYSRVIVSTTGEIMHPPARYGIVSAVPFDNNAYRLLLSDADKHQYVYYSETDAIEALEPSNKAASFSPDGSVLLIINFPTPQQTSYTIDFKPLNTAGLQTQGEQELATYPQNITWSPNEQRIAWSVFQRIMFLDWHDANSLQGVSTVSADYQEIGDWSPDSQQLALTIGKYGQNPETDLLIVAPR